ncbi:MAG: hypothetical protein ACKOZV_13245, partial [Bacteroidota bacterium]
MFFILIALSIYTLLLLSEQALVGVAPAEVEQHREADDRDWQSVVKLYDQLRPALSALLIARILMALLAGTAIAFQLLRSQYLLDFLQNIPSVHQMVWGAVAVLAVLVLTFTLWALARLVLSATKGSNHSQNLMRLAPFVSFWIALNGWMTLRKT